MGNEDIGIIRSAAIAVEDSAVPTLPVQGTPITWADPWLTVIGAKIRYGNDYDLAGDPTFNILEEISRVNTQLDLTPICDIVRKKGLESVEFDMVGLSIESLGAFASTGTVTSNVYEDDGDITYKAVCLEVGTYGVIYCPSVLIITTPITVDESVVGTHVKLMPRGTAAVPVGWQFHENDGV